MFSVELFGPLMLIGVILVAFWSFTVKDDFLGLVGMIFGWIIVLSIIISNKPDELNFKEFQEHKIHSTANTYNNIEGYFTLGTGYIKSEEMYTGNIEVKDEVFERLYIPVYKTQRSEVNYLTDNAIYMEPFCQKKSTWLFYDDNLYDCPRNIQKGFLYIPKGTIIKKFNFQ